MSAPEVTYLIVRHGEAEGNKEHRFIGQIDVPLSALGRRQSHAVCRRLAEIPVTAVISSDLRRAVDTVSPLASQLGLDITRHEGLREIYNGEWSGLLPEEIKTRWPDLWERYRGGEDVARPGGECWSDVRARVVAALLVDVEDRSDGDIVVVGTHGGPVLGILQWAMGVDAGNVFAGPVPPVGNASLTTLKLPSRQVVSLNDVDHLDGA